MLYVYIHISRGKYSFCFLTSTTGGPRHGGDATAPGACRVNFMFFSGKHYSRRLESCFGNSWRALWWNHRKSHLFLDLKVLTISFFARLFSACLKFIQPCCRLTPLKAVLPWVAVSKCVLMSMMSMSWSDPNGKSLGGGGGIFNDVLHIQPCIAYKRNLLFIDHVFFPLWGWFQTTQTTDWCRCLHQNTSKSSYLFQDALADLSVKEVSVQSNDSATWARHFHASDFGHDEVELLNFYWLLGFPSLRRLK